VAATTTTCNVFNVQPFRIEVRLPQRSVDEFDFAFAERVTSAALFLPVRLAPVEVDVGTWVRVELRLDDGTLALGVEGVAAWRYPEGAVPIGREAGVGIAVVAVDVTHRTRFAGIVARTGAGARARVPGQRLLVRQRLPSTALPLLPARPPEWTHEWTHETLPPSSSSSASPVVVAPMALDRLAVLAHALASVDGDATADGAGVRPVSTEAPSSSSSPTSPFLEGSTPADGAAALFEAAELPFALPGEQAFERRSTDVDLLASVSAQDVVSLHGESVAVAADDADLPSLEADLVEEVDDDVVVDLGDDAGGVPGAFRALPVPDTRDERLLLPHGVVGVAFSCGQRGVSGLESVAWPESGTKRAAVGVVDAAANDTAVFSIDPPSSSSDPFAPRVTDPGLSVDGVVARAVEAAQQGDIDADNVFGSSTRTHDSQPVTNDREPTHDAEVPRDADDTGDEPTP
jgi:hypothetical protein